DIGGTEYILTLKGSSQHKRDVVLYDDSNTSVVCSIWDDYVSERTISPCLPTSFF
ncbi:hypothetical protein L915_07563, partial [Phytophthora nicotianae]